MQVAHISKPGGDWDMVERPIPEPAAGHVRIKVQACGICHSEALVKEGHWPGLHSPRVPGHEVVGIVDAVGAGVSPWKPGQCVGIGWHGGHCGSCDACRNGDCFTCYVALQTTGIAFDGGDAAYMVAPAMALALVPDALSAVEAAPLMCAGITTSNALRNGGARAGDLVAMHGLGGLGHLGVQYAANMGFTTVGMARGAEKEALATQLGAHYGIDSQAQDAAAALHKRGGAKVMLTTVTSGEAMHAVHGGLGTGGTLLVVGAAASLDVSPLFVIMGRRSVQGWYSGTAMDAQETLAFSALRGVRSMNDVFPLECVDEAYQHMMSGTARLRVVLTTETQRVDVPVCFIPLALISTTPTGKAV
jgi:D-arabinose 1-dehydrogenase-like Zn-dependent alcohol dehydrogenase